MADQAEPVVFTNRWGDVSVHATAPRRDLCACFDQVRVSNRRRVTFHQEQQDASSPAWQHLLAQIEEAAADGREEFRPLVEMSPQERRQIITLPPTIAKLTSVRHFVLYGSNLVRIPPQIGAMTSLEEFTPYTSYRLHWFPYELTRCPNLRRSTVSTRALYGNEKLRPPFPPLSSVPARPSDFGAAAGGTDAVRTCSVCDEPFEAAGVRQAWLSLRVATDVLPLLVNACSNTCLRALPAGAAG
ncbi:MULTISPECIES: leucine-rich repeat domain-containing protein [unclassified Kitasatospora]|uniref:leucine-rich repeat domain-containing protein n=1 Tax=unclassified Kitasatospora TaxID=2633591 RepID=UPI000AE8ECAB|nr:MULTISPECIES: leucine-rich repeat domain-containing protein [unclassified Kitasatospora]